MRKFFPSVWLIMSFIKSSEEGFLAAKSKFTLPVNKNPPTTTQIFQESIPDWHWEYLREYLLYIKPMNNTRKLEIFVWAPKPPILGIKMIRKRVIFQNSLLIQIIVLPHQE